MRCGSDAAGPQRPALQAAPGRRPAGRRSECPGESDPVERTADAREGREFISTTSVQEAGLPLSTFSLWEEVLLSWRRSTSSRALALNSSARDCASSVSASPDTSDIIVYNTCERIMLLQLVGYALCTHVPAGWV